MGDELDPALIAPIGVSLFLLTLATYFMWNFVVPAWKLNRSLARVLKKLKAKPKSDHWDLAQCFEGDPALQHAWNEYAETLHKPSRFDPNTQTIIKSAPRATVPAEAIFSAQQIVDPQLNVEFFRHLPGIFTGIGIIGTFLGLIVGLGSFQISEDSEIVRHSRTILLHSVSEAFRVSLGAITLAMISTIVEKAYYGSLYAKIERIKNDIDARFESGAGEEYLSRLVDASEGSLTQTKQLKDALISELTALFDQLATRQQASTKALGDHITDQLREPLSALAATNEQLGKDQSHAVQTLLTDVLAGFSEKIENLFGGQMAGISTMQQQTIEAMNAAVRNLNDLSTTLRSAGQDSSDAMAKNLADALAASDARQREMSEGLAALMVQMRDQGAATQSEAQEQTRHMIAQMADKISSVMTALEQQAQNRSAEAARQQGELASHAKGTVDQMAGEVGRLQGEIQGVVSSVRDMIERLEAVSGSLATRLNASTEQLVRGAESFERSGQAVIKSFDQITTVTSNLNTAATGVSAAANSLANVVADYRTARDAVSQMTKALSETVANATKDNSITSDVLRRIEAATTKLVEAQKEAEDYLSGITDVLEESHGAFASAMAKTLKVANSQFHNELSTATGLLKDAIDELEVVLPSSSTKVRQE